jgi:hypothetical protein
MRKLAAIGIFIMLAVVLVAVQAEASIDITFQAGQAKITHINKAKIVTSANHKKHKKHEVKAHLIPLTTEEQVKAKVPAAADKVVTGLPVTGQAGFYLDGSESLSKTIAYSYILRTRK